MWDDGEIRASDSDRENVVTVLREAHAEGRLTLDEFEERVGAAYAARTWASLRELTSDLPAQPVLGTDPGRQRHAGVAWPEVSPARAQRLPTGSRFGPLLPLAAIWIAMVGAAHPASIVVIAGVLLFIMCLRLATRHPHGRGHDSGRAARPE